MKKRPSIRIDAHGDLVLGAEGGELRLRKPLVYQEVNGARREVAGSYVLESHNDAALVGFRLAAYDKTKPLIIDPVLAYSTYLGGSGPDNSLGGGIADGLRWQRLSSPERRLGRLPDRKPLPEIIWRRW